MIKVCVLVSLSLSLSLLYSTCQNPQTKISVKLLNAREPVTLSGQKM